MRGIGEERRNMARSSMSDKPLGTRMSEQARAKRPDNFGQQVSQQARAGDRLPGREFGQSIAEQARARQQYGQPYGQEQAEQVRRKQMMEEQMRRQLQERKMLQEQLRQRQEEQGMGLGRPSMVPGMHAGYSPIESRIPYQEIAERYRNRFPARESYSPLGMGQPDIMELFRQFLAERGL